MVQLKSITIHVTENCDLRCSYCYAGEKVNRCMSSETAKATIDFIRHANEGTPCSITFFGGEPLLAFDLLEEITDRLVTTDDRFRFSLTTSGTIMTDAIVSWIKRNRVHVQISLDGCETAHNRFRTDAAGNGSWDRVVRTCQKLQEEQIPFMTNMVVTPETSPFLMESAQAFRKLGISRFNVAHDTRPVWSEQTIDESVREFAKLTEWYQEMLVENPKFYIGSIDGRVKRALAEAKGQKPHLCAMGMAELSIDYAGRIFPCVQFVTDLSWQFGSVYDGIDRQRQEELVASNRREPQSCLMCELKNRCLHQCGCLNWKTTGLIDQVSPEFCRFEKAFSPHIDRFVERLWESSETIFRSMYHI